MASDLSQDPVANLIKRVLEQDSKDSNRDLASQDFQDMLSTYLQKGMGFQDKHVRADDSSQNLLASKQVLETIVHENVHKKGASVKDFIFKLNVAMGGFWNRKKPDGNGKINEHSQCFDSSIFARLSLTILLILIIEYYPKTIP